MVSVVPSEVQSEGAVASILEIPYPKEMFKKFIDVYFSKFSMYQIHVHISDDQCNVSPVSAAACPSNCDLKECDQDMNHGELCEADQTLPDGNIDYNIDNCCGSYDVFQCDKGTY